MGSIASCEPTGEMTRCIRCPSSTRTAQLTKEPHSCSAAAILGALADPVRLRLGSLAAPQVEICSCDLERSLAKSLTFTDGEQTALKSSASVESGRLLRAGHLGESFLNEGGSR
jgi:hypothetical protein